ncbi:MAG: RagB/SusD family nutrient uptake outer membrane protein [Bacteroidetes bacterium 4484_276]|nr:MAG: RagB/SusD family nutrient uptake outer membrane protein [Bacteroidetes bacterium 4484_276]
MKKIFNITLVIAGFALIFISCTKDLDTVPLDKDVTTSAIIFDDPGSYIEVLAKLYAGLAVSGQEGPSGNGDISGIDEGFGQYLRGWWYHQELPTDEAVISWNDQTIKDFHWQTWGSSDVFIAAMYYRIFYQISACNEYIRETSDGKLSERGVTGDLLAEVKTYRAEARFLRALSYFHAMDLFANVPFVTEADAVGAFFPKQIQRADLFAYIESELNDIEGKLIEPRSVYARADKATAWSLLATLYLNAEVYTGTAKYAECVANCQKVIDAGYSLNPQYQDLFLADNNLNNNEQIFSVAFDGNATRTYGGTNFIIHAAIGGDMNPSDFGVGGGWGGTRTTSAFVNKFPDETGDIDSRAMFFTDGQNKEIVNIGEFTDGYAVTKFKNVQSNGSSGSSLDFPDTDFPYFRLANIYLMYAEAAVHGAGDMGAAVGYVNMIRERAYGDNSGNITAGDLTLDFILDERGRELYWECTRRTDLVRHGKFTGGGYLWPWKGNVAEGSATDSKYNLFPIPSSDIGANPNLDQNDGY